jgi:hypothetical protein
MQSKKPAWKQAALLRHVLPKRLLTYNELHGVISQKIEFFIISVVRTSNPTEFWMFKYYPLNVFLFLYLLIDLLLLHAEYLDVVLDPCTVCVCWRVRHTRYLLLHKGLTQLRNSHARS